MYVEFEARYHMLQQYGIYLLLRLEAYQFLILLFAN